MNTIFLLLFVISMIAIPVMLLVLLVGIIRKRRIKKQLIWLGISFLTWIVSLLGYGMTAPAPIMPESIEVKLVDEQTAYDINSEIPVEITVHPQNADTSMFEYISDSPNVTFEDGMIISGAEEGIYEVYVTAGAVRSNILSVTITDGTAEERIEVEEETQEVVLNEAETESETENAVEKPVEQKRETEENSKKNTEKAAEPQVEESSAEALEEQQAAEAAAKALEEQQAAEAAAKALEEQQAAEAAAKALEEQQAAEAAAKALEEQQAAEAAAKAAEQQISGAYAVNGKNGKIHIVGACSATGNGKNAMDIPVYFETYQDAELYSTQIAPKEKKRQCGNCW